MTAGFKPVFTRKAEVLNALERVFLGGDSPGVKMAAGLAIEILTGFGQSGRPLPAKTKAAIQFTVSVTILTREMDRVLIRKSRRGDLLPRQLLDERDARIGIVAERLCREVSGDSTAELALLGRPLSVELWDDDPGVLRIGINYLAIAREDTLLPDDGAWEFALFHTLNLNRVDPREALALSEMLSTMGVENPYDMRPAEDEAVDGINSAA